MKDRLASLLLVFAALFLAGCGEVSGDKEREEKRALRSAETINKALREEIEALKTEQPPSTDGFEARITELEDELNEVNQENELLRSEFNEYKRQYPLR